jgi:hypothetical protein
VTYLHDDACRPTQDKVNEESGKGNDEEDERPEVSSSDGFFAVSELENRERPCGDDGFDGKSGTCLQSQHNEEKKTPLQSFRTARKNGTNLEEHIR